MNYRNKSTGVVANVALAANLLSIFQDKDWGALPDWVRAEYESGNLRAVHHQGFTIGPGGSSNKLHGEVTSQDYLVYYGPGSLFCFAPETFGDHFEVWGEDASDGDPVADDAPEVNQAQSFEDFSSAPNLLQFGIDAMKDRAASRDNEGERSMAKTVAAFNALSDQSLTEQEGWLFMVCLKEARAMNGPKKIADDYADGAAYFALQGECALREQQQQPQQQQQQQGEASSDYSESEEDDYEEPPSEPKGRQALYSPGERVCFRLPHEARHQTGTVYGEPDSLAIRPDKRPMHPIDINLPLDLCLATSPQG